MDLQGSLEIYSLGNGTCTLRRPRRHACSVTAPAAVQTSSEVITGAAPAPAAPPGTAQGGLAGTAVVQPSAQASRARRCTEMNVRETAGPYGEQLLALAVGSARAPVEYYGGVQSGSNHPITYLWDSIQRLGVADPRLHLSQLVQKLLAKGVSISILPASTGVPAAAAVPARWAAKSGTHSRPSRFRCGTLQGAQQLRTHLLSRLAVLHRLWAVGCGAYEGVKEPEGHDERPHCQAAKLARHPAGWGALRQPVSRGLGPTRVLLGLAQLGMGREGRKNTGDPLRNLRVAEKVQQRKLVGEGLAVSGCGAGTIAALALATSAWKAEMPLPTASSLALASPSWDSSSVICSTSLSLSASLELSLSIEHRSASSGLRGPVFAVMPPQQPPRRVEPELAARESDSWTAIQELRRQQHQRPLHGPLAGATWRASKRDQQDSYRQESVLWAAFKAFDTDDDDGNISKDEVIKVLARGGDIDQVWTRQVCEEVTEELFRQFDKDGNGHLDFEEFVAMMRRTKNRKVQAEAVRLPDEAIVPPTGSLREFGGVNSFKENYNVLTDYRIGRSPAASTRSGGAGSSSARAHSGSARGGPTLMQTMSGALGSRAAAVCGPRGAGCAVM
ncbi:unnamed protein product [Prorocentrum cordatum]|uniref:EF-hand domain-containing protein n=1 Tax=Prorocentrum cordatum TaxID=2364126 RepID=A0ABN9UDB6_9DINO|nr:unnamed protein product [Polarella glacialis]